MRGGPKCGNGVFKEGVGVYDWGLKVLCLCVNLTWDAEAMHFEG